MKAKSPVKWVKAAGIADRSFCRSPVCTRSRVSAAFALFQPSFCNCKPEFSNDEWLAVPPSFRVSQVRVKMDSPSDGQLTRED